jgi:hypothetical protein
LNMREDHAFAENFYHAALVLTPKEYSYSIAPSVAFMDLSRPV